MFNLLDFMMAPLRWLSIGDWNHPSQLVMIALIFSSLATWVVSKTVSGGKSVTVPVSFAVLFGCALTANKYLRDFRLPGTNELQQIIIYTTLGVIVGCAILLATFRSATRGEG
jgi:hypothetical protein